MKKAIIQMVATTLFSIALIISGTLHGMETKPQNTTQANTSTQTTTNVKACIVCGLSGISALTVFGLAAIATTLLAVHITINEQLFAKTVAIICKKYNLNLSGPTKVKALDYALYTFLLGEKKLHDSPITNIMLNNGWIKKFITTLEIGTATIGFTIALALAILCIACLKNIKNTQTTNKT